MLKRLRKDRRRRERRRAVRVRVPKLSGAIISLRELFHSCRSAGIREERKRGEKGKEKKKGGKTLA